MSEIKITELKQLCLQALSKTGLSAAHAEITVDHYLENELNGKASHGMVRVVEFFEVIQNYPLPTKPIINVSDNGSAATFDGQGNLGPVVGMHLVEEAISRANKYSISFVGAHNYIAYTGSMNYYLRKLAKKNCIGIISCNSDSIVTAPNGKDKLVGTNPIGLCVPSAYGNHFIADFATSAIAYGKILVAEEKNETLPEGCIIDKDGHPSQSPHDAKRDGSILPLAGYSGFSLALFVELLAVLVGGKTLKKDWFSKDGMFMIIINPDNLGAHNYAGHVNEILNQIRNSAPAPGHEAVTIPGDRSASIRQENITRGTVDVADKTLEKIKELAA